MERQIATTKEQSARLLQCGVPAYAADMTLSYCKGGFYELMATPFHYGCFNEKDAPAWSLSALLELLPKEIGIDGYTYRISIYFENSDEPVIGNQWCLYYKPKKQNERSPRIDDVTMYAPDLIQCAVDMIIWLKNYGYKLNEQ